MPWFQRKTPEEREQDEQRRQHQREQEALAQQSLASLQNGGIPIQAQRRLDDLRSRKGAFFTSDMSVNEFVLARGAGIQPLSQVMGSSIYHVGWQYLPVYSGSRELEVVTHAFNHARQLALGRLWEEAARVGANAVVGVHVKRASYSWADDLIEFNTVGTAVHLPGAPTGDRPSLTNLSGQDFFKLHQAGYWPVGVVGASTVYYVIASWRTQSANSWWGRFANQELKDFTQGLYTARHLAMRQVHEQAKKLGAGGIVGMEIEQEEEEYEVELGNDTKRTDMIFTFHALGTAIMDAAPAARRPTMYTALSMR